MQKKRERQSPQEFVLEIKDLKEDVESLKQRLTQFMDSLSEIARKIQVENVMYLSSTDQEQSPNIHIVYVILNIGVHRDYFVVESRPGYRALGQHSMKVINSSYQSTQHQFAVLIESQMWALPSDFDDDNFPDWVNQKRADVKKSLNLTKIQEFKSNKEIELDFAAKLRNKDIFNLQNYFDQLQETNLEMFVQACKITPTLRYIEQAFKSGIKDFPPPEPMILTLKAYIENVGGNTLNLSETLEKLGKSSSPYYAICWNMTKIFLTGEFDKKKRCVILTGASNSGKTTMANYCAAIFDSYSLKQTQGIYEQRISPEDANAQLLVINEANMHQLFARNKLNDTKDLFDGSGTNLENKFNHAFTGFKMAFTLITCQHLVYPFIKPLNSSSGFRTDEWPHDKVAMDVRCDVIELTQSFKDETIKFPYTQNEWAHMLLSLYDNFIEAQEPTFGTVSIDAEDDQIISATDPNIINGLRDELLIQNKELREMELKLDIEQKARQDDKIYYEEMKTWLKNEKDKMMKDKNEEIQELQSELGKKDEDISDLKIKLGKRSPEKLISQSDCEYDSNEQNELLDALFCYKRDLQ